MDTTGYRLLKVLFFLVWVIAIINAAAEYWSWYWKILWLDIPMHLAGGVWLGLLGIWLWNHTGYFKRLNKRIHVPTIIIALVFGVVIGVLWESYEYIVWRYSGKGFPLEYAADLKLDLLMDTVGALASVFIYDVLARKMPPPQQRQD